MSLCMYSRLLLHSEDSKFVSVSTSSMTPTMETMGPQQKRVADLLGSTTCFHVTPLVLLLRSTSVAIVDQSNQDRLYSIRSSTSTMMKIAVLASVVASAAAFAPTSQVCFNGLSTSGTGCSAAGLVAADRHVLATTRMLDFRFVVRPACDAMS